MAETRNFWALTGPGQDTADDFGGRDAPKQKFTYTVKITYRTSGVKGAEQMESMNLAVKQSSRPSPTVTMQDVNFYNFRTKVPVRVDYGAITLTFYDDNKNRAHDMFEEYLTTLSPIANLDKGQANSLDTQGHGQSASVGVLNVNRHGIIHDIRLTHHYNGSYTVGDIKKIHYDFLNPKITTMTLDDLDMTSSEAPTVTLNFSYDGVNIVKE